jgi:hypothetical protein
MIPRGPERLVIAKFQDYPGFRKAFRIYMTLRINRKQNKLTRPTSLENNSRKKSTMLVDSLSKIYPM